MSPRHCISWHFLHRLGIRPVNELGAGEAANHIGANEADLARSLPALRCRGETAPYSRITGKFFAMDASTRETSDLDQGGDGVGWLNGWIASRRMPN